MTIEIANPTTVPLPISTEGVQSLFGKEGVFTVLSRIDGLDAWRRILWALAQTTEEPCRTAQERGLLGDDRIDLVLEAVRAWCRGESEDVEVFDLASDVGQAHEVLLQVHLAACPSLARNGTSLLMGYRGMTLAEEHLGPLWQNKSEKLIPEDFLRHAALRLAEPVRFPSMLRGRPQGRGAASRLYSTSINGFSTPLCGEATQDRYHLLLEVTGALQGAWELLGEDAKAATARIEGRFRQALEAPA